MSLVQSTSQPVPAFAGGASAAKRMLDVEVPTQDQTNWCWCAVTLGLRRYYSQSTITAKQCEIADEVLGVGTACQAPNSVNVMHDLADALGRYGLLASSALEGGLSFQEIVNHIDAQRPIGAQVLFLDSGQGHVLVIRGYRKEGGTEHILIDDPRFGEDDIPLAQFTQRYREWGEWTLTYLTRSPSD
ncbi:papain-like cysteine protease family protein [Variovorax humicola]|uniref:Papain-like cysteine protease family protein n=1 Tax=Variovorax humicola TaxID=1769758 RepID=A0ABU8WAX9_9BURK